MRLCAHKQEVFGLKWSFDERSMLASGGNDNKLKHVSSGGAPTAGSFSLLASGSRDRLIHLRDPRSESAYEMRLCAHKKEVCGLKWSFDERSMLASGGNDNKLLVLDIKKHTSPIHSFGDHTAAVKDIT